MKRAISISLGSSSRDKRVVINFKGEDVIVERIGTDGDIEKAKQLFHELDGKIDAFGVGGVDMYLRLEDREYPLGAVLKMLEGVNQTPLVDGRGLKHTLERHVFDLAQSELGKMPHFQQAFVPVAIDRIGLAQAAAQVSEKNSFWRFNGRAERAYSCLGVSSIQPCCTSDAALCVLLSHEYDFIRQRWRRAQAQIQPLF